MSDFDRVPARDIALAILLVLLLLLLPGGAGYDGSSSACPHPHVGYILTTPWVAPCPEARP